MNTRKSVQISLFLFLGVLLCTNLWAQSKIKLHVDGLRDSAIIFGYYYGEGRYVQDTLHLDGKGDATFTRDSSLADGLYLFLFPGGEVTNLLIGREQNFTYSLDINTLDNSQKVEGATLSSDFLEFQNFMGAMQKQGELLRKEDSLLRAANLSEQELKEKRQVIREKFGALDEQVHTYQKELLKNNEGNILAEFVRGTIPITVPEFKPAPEIKNVDSARWMWSYAYNASHYLDNFNLASSFILRTPIVVPKINFYLDKMLLQIPDTLNKYCDKILERAYLNPESFRFWTSFLLNKYSDAKIVGLDAIFVHIADEYYLKGRTPWSEKEYLEKLEDRVKHMRPNLLWQVAPNFKVETLTGQTYELLKDNAEVTVLVFWEPSCSHCKVAVPKIDSIARTYDTKRLRVIGFMTTGDGPEWQKYVEEHKLFWWVNVWDPYRKSDFATTYDIYSTPVIYVLDKNHKIVMKRIGAETLPAILDELLKKK